MTTLSEYKTKAAHNICCYGRAKTGKTALIGQLARLGYQLHWLDLENGVKTLLKPDMLAPEFHKNVHVYRIPSMQTIPMGIETVLKVMKGTECRICWIHGKVGCQVCSKVDGAEINTLDLSKFTLNDWLVVDSVTQLSNDANSAVLKDFLTKADLPESYIIEADAGVTNFKYPRAVNFMLDKIFSTMQAGNFNCAVISHETMTERLKDTGHKVGKNDNQPNDNVEIVVPTAGSRNFSRNFGRYFDMLIHCDVVNMKHKAQSSSTADTTFQSGSRTVNLEDIKDKDGKPVPPFEAMLKVFARHT